MKKGWEIVVDDYNIIDFIDFFNKNVLIYI